MEEQNTDTTPTKQNQKNTKSSMTELLAYLHDIVYSLSAVILVIMLIFKINVVSGPSMKNTLYNGDYLIILNNIFYPECKQGDIVVASKKAFKNGELIIKRVIATEGQTVDIDFERGLVFVDNVMIEENYVKTPTNLYEGVEFPLTVDENCLFVMGDNRNESKDSRNPDIGLIDKREVMGKAIFLFFPGPNPETNKREYDRIGVLS